MKKNFFAAGLIVLMGCESDETETPQFRNDVFKLETGEGRTLINPSNKQELIDIFKSHAFN
ncbi:MAG: hypothetical protein HYZ14_06025 [Bacteroidetes bacterium]|nr:hypothetical protein [Bacteroidota bacterium]